MAGAVALVGSPSVPPCSGRRPIPWARPPATPISSTRPRLSYWPLHVGGWAAFGLAWGLGRAGEMEPLEIAIRETAFAGLAALITAAMRVVYDRLRLSVDAPARTVAVSLGVSYAGSVAWTLLFYGYLHRVAPVLYAALTGSSVPAVGSSWIFDGVVFHWSILLGWTALYLGLQYASALRDERERALRAEAHAHRARLQALRYQLNPHFLFNALNGVSTLVTEARTREATDMLAHLSDFLRLTLEADDASEVALADEIEFVRRYLDIEQARFGDRLAVRIDVAPETLGAAVPAHAFQPLVENAVKYAVAPRRDGGSITIEATRDGDTLVVAIVDDGPGLTPGDGPASGLGVGLGNVRDRLQELYGADGHLVLDETTGGGLRATMRFPFRLLDSTGA